MQLPEPQTTFDPKGIEARVQADWVRRDVYRAQEATNKPLGKYYACSMLPYPSGKLHMGHVRNYTINDMLARHLRKKGYNVLMPMGWDAFGLPAENAAFRNKVQPAAWTYDNIAGMKRQLQAMGLAIDWSREVTTCDPDYYRWNQWFFLKLLERGIAYRTTQVVNWDPVDQTVLANEQVIDGRGWRTGALVQKREIPGYYLRITAYAQELLDCVSDPTHPNFLKGWPERVRLMQENWLGKSEGVRFAFTHTIDDAQGRRIQDGRMYVFTTRADTLMGVTFCAVAPEHPLAIHAAAHNAQIAAFLERCSHGGTTEAELAHKEKEGMPLGLTVHHPLTGKPIEVWVGNYVLMSYGDGAVMGVPAHDERDFAFANKYGIAIEQVIDVNNQKFDSTHWQEWYAQTHGGVCVRSGALDGLAHKEAVQKAAELLQEKGLGELKTTWRLRDWSISRQRYWGTPIPVIHCANCGAVPVPEKDLPVVLPQDLVPDGSGNPLNRCEAFLRVPCPSCGLDARRETDTMDTFVDSSWYFMRYCSPHNHTQMSDAATEYWMGTAGNAPEAAGMDQYIGGIEHAVLHLLYARFWVKVMRDLGLTRVDEPFRKLLCQGMVLNHIYCKKDDRGGIEYFWASDVEHQRDASGKLVGVRLKNAVGNLAAGTALTYEGLGTMSKSRNNGVDPQELIDKYGADTVRLYMMFTAPPEATLEWNEVAVEGSYRFLRRVWNFAIKNRQSFSPALYGTEAGNCSNAGKALRLEVHGALKQADFDYGRMQYNTVVSATMKMLNALETAELDTQSADQAALTECFALLLNTLYPICPHISTCLWQMLGFENAVGELLDSPWPQVDPLALHQEEIELMLQINGKLRGSIRVSAQASNATIESVALTSSAYLKQAALKPPKKVVIVPGRLVNVVL